jgi:hypothetical protein
MQTARRSADPNTAPATAAASRFKHNGGKIKIGQPPGNTNTPQITATSAVANSSDLNENLIAAS